MQTLKWFIIARKQKIPVPFKEAIKMNLKSNFYGFITPSKIGAIIRAKYLKKYSGNLEKGICNFTLDKILDIISVMFIALIFSLIFYNKFSIFPNYSLIIGYLIILFIILIILMFVFINKERSKFFLRIIYRKLIPLKFKKRAKLSFDFFYDNIPKPKYFLGFFFMNIFNWIIIYFITFVIALALNIELNFIYFLAILPIGTLVGLIPITINGWGTREATLIVLFSLFGIDATKVFSMSLLSLFFTALIPAIVSIFFILGDAKKRS